MCINHLVTRRRPPLHLSLRGEAGISLIETVVWVSMFTAAMFAITSTVLAFYRTSNFAIQEASAITSAQRGLDSIVRAIREASYASNGAYPIVAIATSSLVFYAEVDGDAGVERVRYYLSGTNLMRGVVEPAGDPVLYTGAEVASVVSDSVRNNNENLTLFTYFDNDGALVGTTTLFGDVRFITVNISVDIDPNRTPTTTKLRSSAALRNLIGQ